MTTFASPPLIEAIFELRWGNPTISEGILRRVEFSKEDQQFFIGQFHGVAKSRGFSHVERINQSDADSPVSMALFPHVVSYRFRRAQDTWPCYQIGLGVFTVNQVNEGYEWKQFKAAIIEGLGALDSGHPNKLSGLNPIGVELRYQDGFYFDPGESAIDFLRNKLNINFSTPKGILDLGKSGGQLEGNHLEFSLSLDKPQGVLISDTQQALINGRPGFVMNTIVRSTDEFTPPFEINSLESWLEDAHDIQRAAFDAVINEAYAKSFK
ncbi:MAG: TIGR04255 family protein [Sulfuricella denitrificans]|nr:TIGR04255 family protein [Sulfuricella denitrificans]